MLRDKVDVVLVGLFFAIAAMEEAFKISTDRLISLSEQ